jgi:P pilus assembly chaperone PapD
MKSKVKFSIAISAALLFSSLVNAATGAHETVTVKNLKDQRMLVTIQNPSEQSISLQLSSGTDGEILYKSTIKAKDQYNAVYNLSELPEGRYTLICSIANRIYEKDIILGAYNSEVMAETSYLAPVFHQDGKNLTVTVFNPKDNDVSVSFWKGSESIFADSPKSDRSFKRLYSLDKLEPGQYTVDVATAAGSYQYAMELK